MLATLHLYQVLDVGDTIHVPISDAGDNIFITDVGCWRHYTHIPGVLYLWYTTEIYILPMVKLIYSVFATKQI